MMPSSVVVGVVVLVGVSNRVGQGAGRASELVGDRWREGGSGRMVAQGEEQSGAVAKRIDGGGIEDG